MDIVGCGILGFENWDEGLLNFSSSGVITDLPTETISKGKFGLGLSCKPLEDEEISRDIAPCEQSLLSTSKNGQLIRGQINNAHVEKISHPSHLGTGSILETNTPMIAHEFQEKAYSSCPRILEGSGGDECFISRVKSSIASSTNGKKRKQVFHERSRFAESKKDKRNRYKGEESDDKQISGKSPVSNTCWELEGAFVKERLSTKNNPKEDHVQVKTKCIQLINNRSRAERIRREKISERMKFLQNIVPGCSKIIGKAVMLDEIINYVLSLQQQIEFLSRKVETILPGVYLDDQQIPSRYANSNMIHHLQDGSRSMFGGPGGQKIHSFRTIQDEFSQGTLLDTQNLNHLKVLLPQASMWNDDNPSRLTAAIQYSSWSDC